MKTLVISDLHSNEPALRAVLRHASRKGISRVLCMGDFVGYGGQPNQVVDAVRTLRGAKVYIRGNHDRVAIGVDDGRDFNEVARAAALWTRTRLSRMNLNFLSRLPIGPVAIGDQILLCHGSPFDEDEYLFSEYDAFNVFNAHPQRLIFFGHTHLPSFFVIRPDGAISGWLIREPMSFRLEAGERYLINPGSVGQPRDRNSLAAYAIFDDVRQTIHFHRVEYEIWKAQQPILEAGLPRILADRLFVGA
jgi:predicted phosphodiesterase